MTCLRCKALLVMFVDPTLVLVESVLVPQVSVSNESITCLRCEVLLMQGQLICLSPQSCYHSNVAGQSERVDSGASSRLCRLLHRLCRCPVGMTDL